MERLKTLLKDYESRRGDWVKGYIPTHYKRATASPEELDRLARIGCRELIAAYMDGETPVPLYTQAVIAGAMLSGDYDSVYAVTPSQYGKSFVLGYTAPLLAYGGTKLSLAGANQSVTSIIMQYARSAVRDAAPEIRKALVGDGLKKIDKLDSSLSKSRIGFATGGYLEALTLGDTYDGNTRNKAVGRGTAYIVDEAAQVSDEALAEIGRRELSGIDGTKQLLVMISNPHKPGAFYDALTGPADDRTLIIWMDALTAAQEGRWTPDQILESDFAKHRDTRTVYWMCELPEEGAGMLDTPKVGPPIKGERVHFLGIDAAYKGADDVAICHLTTGEGGVYVEETATVQSRPWIDGVTPEIICDTIARVYFATGCQLACCDTGQGIWLVEGLLRRGVNVKGIAFGSGATAERVKANHYAAVRAGNMRAEMHLDLQQLIESGQITFSPDVWEQVEEVFPYITYKLRASSGMPKVIVRSKDEIKAICGHSPDAFDATLLALHAAILSTAESVY